MKQIRRKSGVTLGEVLVAAFLMSIMCGALYGIWSRVSYTRSLTTARGIAKDEVEICLKQLERDISMARATTFTTAGNTMTMDISQKDGALTSKKVPIAYSWTGSKLTRKDNVGERVLTSHLAQNYQGLSGGIAIYREAASGSVNIKIAAEVKPEGYANLPQTHVQDILITIREEAAGAGSDTRWVKPVNLDPTNF
ncbi:MAG: hypothetical protein HQM09_05755 [Candidatus Riflebacteria bacterium]|nr:hypothetical protein [Candidatus Riflebacteria bacterium]